MFTPYIRIIDPIVPPFRGPADRMIRGIAEKKKHSPDDKTRPRPIPGWPVEPEIFTEILFNRRKSRSKRPYLVRHPKMSLKQAAVSAGLSMEPPGGGASADCPKVTIAVETHVDTPRPAAPHQIYSNQELIDLQCKEGLYHFL